MFKLLLLSPFNDELLNNSLGIYRSNFVDVEMTSSSQAGRAIFDIHQCINTIPAAIGTKLLPGRPTLFDADHIDQNASGRRSLRQALLILQQAMLWGTQIGFARAHHPGSPILKGPTSEQLNEIITTPFIPDKLSNTSLLELVQFIVCWAHPFTDNWDNWEQLLVHSIGCVEQYRRPLYVDITNTYHRGCKCPKLRSRPLEPPRLAWVIQKAYEHGYDGALLRSNLPIKPGGPHHEAIIGIMNQINEQ